MTGRRPPEHEVIATPQPPTAHWVSNHPQHTERLAAYWAEALGGPTHYSEQYGDETSVVRIHSGNGPHEDMDRRAIACFDQVLVDVGVADDEWLRQVRKRCSGRPRSGVG